MKKMAEINGSQRKNHQVLAVLAVVSAVGGGPLCEAGSAWAIQPESQAEKEANLKGQALGGLFNRWTFDQQKADEAPAGFRTLSLSEGTRATWTIRSEVDAPSLPNILHASSVCESNCLKLLVADGFEYEYPDVSVRIRVPENPPAGSGGIVFGVRDEKNYYAALIDLGAKTVAVIRVNDGQETVIGEAPITPKATTWHSFRIQRNTIVSKDFIETFFDGQLVLTVRDQSLGIGQVGLALRGKTSLQFDSLHAIPLFSQRPLSAPAAY